MEPQEGRIPERALVRLRGRERFELFVRSADVTVVVAWHYLCDACVRYKPTVLSVAGELHRPGALAFGLVHLQLPWMIAKAGLQGEVEVENDHLTAFGVGDAVPVTLRFERGAFQRSVVGALGADQLRSLALHGREGTAPPAPASATLRPML